MSERKIKLQIKDMTKKYDNGDGVEHINLDIYEGEIVTFLGPSGCGKTTILRTIGGFLDVTSGDITIDGQSIIGLPPEKRPTAMVFQSYNLWPHMTIYENLAFGLKLRKVPKAEIDADIKKMLALVSMSGCEKKYPNQMSGGQQQRIAIARSLLLKPSLLLLDEPFSALDAKIRQQMREELKKIQSDLGITVVFVTHDQEEAMSLSHRIVVMNKGKFEQIGTPTEIYDKPATRHVASFIGEMNFIDKGDKTIGGRHRFHRRLGPLHRHGPHHHGPRPLRSSQRPARRKRYQVLRRPRHQREAVRRPVRRHAHRQAHRIRQVNFDHNILYRENRASRA